MDKAHRCLFQNSQLYLHPDITVNFEKGAGLLYGLLSDRRTRLRQKHPVLKAPEYWGRMNRKTRKNTFFHLD